MVPPVRSVWLVSSGEPSSNCSGASPAATIFPDNSRKGFPCVLLQLTHTSIFFVVAHGQKRPPVPLFWELLLFVGENLSLVFTCLGACHACTLWADLTTSLFLLRPIGCHFLEAGHRLATGPPGIFSWPTVTYFFPASSFIHKRFM